MPESLNRRDFIKAATVTTLVAGAALGQSPIKGSAYPFVDGLCLDVPEDPAEIKASGLSGYIFDASAVGEVKTPDGSPKWLRNYDDTLKRIAGVRAQLRKSPNAFLATEGREIERAFKEGKTAVFLQVQGGGEIVATALDRINVLGAMGLRVLQMTHHHNNALAGGGIEKTPSGLTKLGYEAVERLNAVRIVPDLSHASDQTALDTAKASKKPVILSHGAARAFVNNARCAPDNVIKAIADSGGVIGIFMMSFWLTNDPIPTVDHYVAHIRHVAKVGVSTPSGSPTTSPSRASRTSSTRKATTPPPSKTTSPGGTPSRKWASWASTANRNTSPSPPSTTSTASRSSTRH